MIEGNKNTDSQQKYSQAIHLEIEGKWHLQNLTERDNLKKLLKKLGGRLMGSHDEINRLFDDATAKNERSGIVLRLRFINGGTRALLTFKGQVRCYEGVKERIEQELEANDGLVMEQIFRGLGFSMTIEYPKTRETWQFANAKVMLDELPFGYYCEIEGSPATIKEVADALGLDFDKRESRDYPTLMLEYHQSQRRLTSES